MIRRVYGLALSLVPVASACLLSGWIIRNPAPPAPATVGAPAVPEEAKHLGHVRQLTFGGQNAEAYFSLDDKYLIFQHQGEGVPCDQIYTIPVDPPEGPPAVPNPLSTSKGTTTSPHTCPSAPPLLLPSTHHA